MITTNDAMVKVRFVDAREAMAGLAASTCIGTTKGMYHPGKLEARLELFRVVVLTVQGGFYADPEYMFSREVHSFVAIAGEFVMQQPMSQMLSTEVMHLRRGSSTGYGWHNRYYYEPGWIYTPGEDAPLYMFVMILKIMGRVVSRLVGRQPKKMRSS